MEKGTWLQRGWAADVALDALADRHAHPWLAAGSGALNGQPAGLPGLRCGRGCRGRGRLLQARRGAAHLRGRADLLAGLESG